MSKRKMPERWRIFPAGCQTHRPTFQNYFLFFFSFFPSLLSIGSQDKITLKMA